MEEYIEKNQEIKTAETAEDSENSELMRLVQEKHSEMGRRDESEHLSDVFVMQLGLCILLLLAAAAVNLFNAAAVHSFIGEFKRMTGGETEEIYRRAAEMVMKFLE